MIVLNGAPWIGRQLDALAQQRDTPGGWEVVVADNGSTDGTQDLVRARVEDFPVPLRLADASTVPGVSHARNVGASAARGMFLAFCDCDDLVSETWVRDAAAAMRAHGCVVGTNRALTEPHDPDSEVLNPNGLVGRGIHGCNFGVHRDLYFSVGGFDESLPPYGCDDAEFSVRLLESGHVIRPAGGMVLYFRRTVGLRRTIRKVYLSGIAETVVWQRHPDRFASHLGIRRALVDVVSWPASAARELAGGGATPRAMVRSAVTVWAHLVGQVTWVRSGRAGSARLAYAPYDLSEPAPPLE